MMTRLAKDPIVRSALVLWVVVAAFYVIPGVPADVRVRLGERYSTLPMWPWAIAAALVGLAAVRLDWLRRVWRLQAASFVCLLGIEAARGAANDTSALAWDLTAEWIFLAYYACQLMAGAEALGAGSARPALRRSARRLVIGLCLVAGAGLTLLATQVHAVYESTWPSYVTYLILDAGTAWTWWRARALYANPLRAAFTGLALASCLFFATDFLDLLYYTQVWQFQTGTLFDLCWTLAPLCFVLTIRAGRLDDGQPH
jgi:hypothetical protein